MAAMLRDAAVSGAGHFGGPPPPPTGAPGQLPPHGLPASAVALHAPPPFSRYSGLRHPGPPQQALSNSQTAGPPQSAVEVAAEIW